MTPDQAAWVREHVWTQQMRDLHTVIRPGYYTTCQCQKDASSHCKRGAHERCFSFRLFFSREGMVCDRSGVEFVAFAKSYRHRTIDGPPNPTPVAQVWLADRICRWVCSCPCGHPRPRPAHAAAQPAPAAAPKLTADGLEIVTLPGLDLIARAR